MQVQKENEDKAGGKGQTKTNGEVKGMKAHDFHGVLSVFDEICFVVWFFFVFPKKH